MYCNVFLRKLSLHRDDMDAPFDVESLRDEHESNSEWRMRREFLLANYQDLPFNRLICLSRCFINIEVYGCTYPSEVMAQVRELSSSVNPKIMAAQRERMTQKYADLLLFFFKLKKNIYAMWKNGPSAVGRV